jgi:hypothetical protein
MRFILDYGVQLARGLPKEAERPVTACMVPDARCDDTTLPSHARHLTQSSDRVLHEMNDELCQGRVEGFVRKRQFLGRRASHGDLRVALLNRCNERF